MGKNHGSPQTPTITMKKKGTIGTQRQRPRALFLLLAAVTTEYRIVSLRWSCQPVYHLSMAVYYCLPSLTAVCGSVFGRVLNSGRLHSSGLVEPALPDHRTVRLSGRLSNVAIFRRSVRGRLLVGSWPLPDVSVRLLTGLGLGYAHQPSLPS